MATSNNFQENLEEKVNIIRNSEAAMLVLKIAGVTAAVLAWISIWYFATNITLFGQFTAIYFNFFLFALLYIVVVAIHVAAAYGLMVAWSGQKKKRESLSSDEVGHTPTTGGAV